MLLMQYGTPSIHFLNLACFPMGSKGCQTLLPKAAKEYREGQNIAIWENHPNGLYALTNTYCDKYLALLRRHHRS